MESETIEAQLKECKESIEFLNGRVKFLELQAYKNKLELSDLDEIAKKLDDLGYNRFEYERLIKVSVPTLNWLGMQGLSAKDDCGKLYYAGLNIEYNDKNDKDYEVYVMEKKAWTPILSIGGRNP